MRDLTILLTSAGNPGFVGALRGLKMNEERNINVVAADCSWNAYGRYMADDFCLVPTANDPGYISEIQRIIKKKNIDVVIPLSTPESVTLSEKKGGTQALVMVPDSPQVRHSANKFIFYFQSKKIGIKPPRYEITNFENLQSYALHLGYPEKVLCVKPKDGYGSRGFVILDSSADTISQYYNEKSIHRMTVSQFLGLFHGENKEILVMDYIEGTEYSVDLLMKNEIVLTGCVRRRDKVLGGISNQATVIDRPDILSMCKKLVEYFSLNYCVGVQLIEDKDGKLWPIEINPRLQGTTILSIAAGLNCPYLGVKALLGEPFEIPKIKFGTKMARHWEEIFFYGGESYGERISCVPAPR